MVKYLTLILIITTTALNAQVMDSNLSIQGTQYQSPEFNEKLHVTLNSDFILVGESLLFTIRCFNAISGTSSDLSVIAYVEIINENLMPVLQTRIELLNGIGSGDFFLPSSLNTGNYTLVAYTNWMRNFPTEYFYRTTLTIINPFKRPNYQISTINKELNIEFFPEGGFLLTESSNTIGFVIPRNTKMNPPYTIRILDDLGTLVTESISSLDGTGIINLIPLRGRVYKAIISDRETSIVKDLPVSKNEGIGIHTVRSEEFTSITLTHRGQEDSVTAMLSIQHHGNTIHKSSIKFNSDTANLKISNKILPAGLSQLIIFNKANQIECEKAIFNRPDPPKQLRASLAKNRLKHREKVSLTINLNDSIEPVLLSVNVRKIENHPNTTSLSANMADNSMSDQQLDFQCLSYRKEKTYNIVTGHELQNPKYLPELRGMIISGNVKTLTNAPFKNELVYLSIPSTNYLFLVSKTDTLGNFYLITNKLKYNTDILLQLRPENKNKYRINIKNEFLDDYTNLRPSPFLIDSSFSELIKERSIISQLENAYYSEKSDSIISNVENNRFYGLPDKVYFLDDYVRFPTLNDVFIEYIPEISLRKKGELYTIRVANYKTGAAFNEEPLILLDGIPIFDHNQVIDLNPLLIKKIEIIKKRYFYGPLDVSGIISLETYKGNGMNIPFKDYIMKEIIGVQPKKTYYQPNYESEETKRIPDFRIQLFWDPALQLITDQPKLIEFYTSDVAGDFEINIQGIDRKGNRISWRDVISVDQQPN